jgi:PhnB protein
VTDIDTATALTRPDPAVMRGVIPYLNLRGRAGEAADFYARAFGATDLGRMPAADQPGQFMHIQVEINRGVLMMTDHQHDGQGPGSAMQGGHLQLVVSDGRHWWDRAIDAGCREVMPFEPQFWGDTWGLVEDPFGIQWAILEPGQQG